jgi:hypothetical protein
VTPDGSPPHRDDPYFVNRSRKFSIQIEGRFKHREGVAPYTADEVSLPRSEPSQLLEMIRADRERSTTSFPNVQIQFGR